MRYVIEFDSPDEMASTLAVLRGATEATKPVLALVNATGQSIILVAKPAGLDEQTGQPLVNVELHSRGTVETHQDGQSIPGVTLLAPGSSFLLG